MTHTKIAAVFLIALVVAGCADQQATKPNISGGTESNQGVQTSGATENAAPEAVPGAAGTTSEAQFEKRVHFAFDSSAIDDTGRAIVEANAKYLSAHADEHVKLEGNTDERGTREYNLALGDRRAQAVERMLKELGIAPTRISTISYGKEHPVAHGHGEDAWAQNRRVDFVYAP